MDRGRRESEGKGLLLGEEKVDERTGKLNVLSSEDYEKRFVFVLCLSFIHSFSPLFFFFQGGPSSERGKWTQPLTPPTHPSLFPRPLADGLVSSAAHNLTERHICVRKVD